MAQGRQHTDLSQEATAALWEVYRGGKLAACPNDGGALALSVDAASGYRLVCTNCGTASPWFEAGANGVQVRNLAVASDSDFDGD
jgi:hypothetical protein